MNWVRSNAGVYHRRWKKNEMRCGVKLEAPSVRAHPKASQRCLACQYRGVHKELKVTRVLVGMGPITQFKRGRDRHGSHAKI